MYTGAQINFWDLTSYLTYEYIPVLPIWCGTVFGKIDLETLAVCGKLATAEAKFIVPYWGDKSRLWHKVDVPARKPMWTDGPVRQPYAIVNFIQSWAHRSYELSERSKSMSDLWFSEWKKMSVERWANCHKKEFAQCSKRSLNLKERAFLAIRSLSEVTM